MNLFSPLSSKAAYLLVIHGSRDPRPWEAVQALAHQVGLGLGGDSLVGAACLECADRSLHQQIMMFGDRALRIGCQSIKIIPLFLLPGVHVREDIPEEVALAQKALEGTLTLEVLPYLGSYPDMVNLLTQRIKVTQQTHQLHCLDRESSTSLGITPVILMAHGSRRAGGNRPIEALATQLGATPAYWSVSPQLPDQIQTLSKRGYDQIIVMPYFLFAGGITDAIAQRIFQLNHEHPSTTITLSDPLGAKSDIASLIAQNITQHIGQEQQNLVTSITTSKY